MLKEFLFNTATFCGVHTFFRMIGRHKILILMYHGVIKEELPVPCWWQLPYEKFEWQMKYLKKHYTILPLREVVTRIQNGQPLPANTAVITFDDGFQNNYTLAYPLLKKLNIPATIFIVTDLIGTDRLLWQDELFMFFMDTKETALDLKKIGLGTYDLKDISAKKVSLFQVSRHLKEIESEKKNEALAYIRSQLVAGHPLSQHAENFKLLSWEQVDQIRREGLVDFGSHSATHEILSQLNEEQLKKEICSSCDRLLPMGQVVFAYPNGRKKDYTANAKNYLASCGVLCSVTTFQDLNSVDQDVFELNRMSIGNDTTQSGFKLLCSGFIRLFKSPPAPLEKKTKNIVFLTDCFSDTTAGAEKQIVELVKRLDKFKYRLIIVSLDYCGPSVAPLLTSYGCQVKVIRVKRIYGLSGLIQGIRFFRLLRREKIDILQTYHFGSDIWGTVIGALAGVKTIYSNRRDMGFWRGDMHVRTYKMVNRWVKKIIVNARSIKDMVVASEHVLPQNVQVIYNGVEMQASQGPSVNRMEFRRSIGVDDNDLVVLHVANLKPVKGHVFLLRALPDILKEHPRVKLVLVGEDMLGGQLQKAALELGIDKNVVFLSKRKDIGDLLSVADIGVLPSLSEGMSNAILEYMIAGRPVVATNVGGTPELIEDGLNGFLVPKENSAALKEALLKLIRDEDLRKTLGARGRQKALEQFSMQGMLNNYARLYEQSDMNAAKILVLSIAGDLFFRCHEMQLQNFL